MGTYATTTSLETLMVGTTFDTATTSLCSKMITHAENEVNKYLSKRYDLSAFNTSTSIPPLVTSWAESLAEGYMYMRMSRGGEKWDKRGLELIKMIQKNMQDVADYKLDLINSGGTPITDFSNSAYRVLSNTSNYSTTFGEDDELNWTVDQDKLDDIESERD